MNYNNSHYLEHFNQSQIYSDIYLMLSRVFLCLVLFILINCTLQADLPVLILAIMNKTKSVIIIGLLIYIVFLLITMGDYFVHLICLKWRNKKISNFISELSRAIAGSLSILVSLGIIRLLLLCLFGIYFFQDGIEILKDYVQPDFVINNEIVVLSHQLLLGVIYATLGASFFLCSLLIFFSEFMQAIVSGFIRFVVNLLSSLVLTDNKKI